MAWTPAPSSHRRLLPMPGTSVVPPAACAARTGLGLGDTLAPATHGNGPCLASVSLETVTSPVHSDIPSSICDPRQPESCIILQIGVFFPIGCFPNPLRGFRKIFTCLKDAKDAG